MGIQKRLTKVTILVLNRWDNLDLFLQIDSYGHRGYSPQVIYSDSSFITNVNEFFQTRIYDHLCGYTWYISHFARMFQRNGFCHRVLETKIYSSDQENYSLIPILWVGSWDLLTKWLIQDQTVHLSWRMIAVCESMNSQSPAFSVMSIWVII